MLRSLIPVTGAVTGAGAVPGSAMHDAVSLPVVDLVLSWLDVLATMTDPGSDATRIATIAALERLKAAAAAAQARFTSAFADSQEERQREAGVPARHRGQGVAEQIALARRVSPTVGSRCLGLARALRDELPKTMEALRAGDVSEWRAVLVARETACLSPEDRRRVDADLAPILGSLGDGRVVAEASRRVAEIDAAVVAERNRRAIGDRRVSLRPAPDTMTWLTALLPMADGVGVMASLERSASTARAAGDERTRGQVMADSLVGAVLGRSASAARRPPALPSTPASARPPVIARSSPFAPDIASAPEAVLDRPSLSSVPYVRSEPARPAAAGTPTPATSRPASPRARPVVELNVVMTDRTLFGHGEGADEAAWVHGYGPVPAAVARDLVRTTEAQVWLRRLFAPPDGTGMVAMESARRTFDAGLRRLLVVRDAVCRTPWCGAPIRHLDHVRSVADGGRTTVDNGQGLCEACNYAKQAPGWTAAAGPGGSGESVTTTTPTGSSYSSSPPDLPGARRVRQVQARHDGPDTAARSRRCYPTGPPAGVEPDELRRRMLAMACVNVNRAA